MGISYSPKDDKFFFEKDKLQKISEAPIESKRQLLATIPRIFDPLHIVSPLILRGRLLFSECCSNDLNLGWDDPLNDTLLKGIKEWQEIIPLCGTVEINRWIPFPENRQNCFILTAGDGAERAFGARSMIYIPLEELPEGAPHGNVHVGGKLVCRPNTKSNFASFYALSRMKIVGTNQKNWSTQKSELKAALLAAELTSYLSKTFEIPLKTVQ